MLLGVVGVATSGHVRVAARAARQLHPELFDLAFVHVCLVDGGGEGLLVTDTQGFDLNVVHIHGG